MAKAKGTGTNVTKISKRGKNDSKRKKTSQGKSRNSKPKKG